MLLIRYLTSKDYKSFSLYLSIHITIVIKYFYPIIDSVEQIRTKRNRILIARRNNIKTNFQQAMLQARIAASSLILSYHLA